MAKRSETSVTITDVCETPIENPSRVSSIRFNEDDYRYIEAIQKDSGISNISDVIRDSLRANAKLRKLKI